MFVRTRRSHQALNVTVGDKQLEVTSIPLEVSAADAKAVQEAGDLYGVPVEVTDQAPDVAGVRPGVGSAIGPDLSRGIGAISGHGLPVETFAEPAEAQPDPDVLASGGDPYEGMLKSELESAVDARNDGRAEGDKITVGGNGTVADLKTALVADDNKEL